MEKLYQNFGLTPIKVFGSNYQNDTMLALNRNGTLYEVREQQGLVPRTETPLPKTTTNFENFLRDRYPGINPQELIKALYDVYCKKDDTGELVPLSVATWLSRLEALDTEEARNLVNGNGTTHRFVTKALATSAVALGVVGLHFAYNRPSTDSSAPNQPSAMVQNENIITGVTFPPELVTQKGILLSLREGINLKDPANVYMAMNINKLPKTQDGIVEKRIKFTDEHEVILRIMIQGEDNAVGAIDFTVKDIRDGQSENFLKEAMKQANEKKPSVYVHPDHAGTTFSGMLKNPKTTTGIGGRTS